MKPTLVNKFYSLEESKADKIFTLLNLIEAHLAGICQVGHAKHVNHVSGEILYYRTIYPDANVTSEYHEDPLQAYNAVADPDTLYHHQVMKQHDWLQFRTAIQKEIDDIIKKRNFSVMNKSKVSKSATLLPVVR